MVARGRWSGDHANRRDVAGTKVGHHMAEERDDAHGQICGRLPFGARPVGLICHFEGILPNGGTGELDRCRVRGLPSEGRYPPQIGGSMTAHHHMWM